MDTYYEEIVSLSVQLECTNDLLSRGAANKSVRICNKLVKLRNKIAESDTDRAALVCKLLQHENEYVRLEGCAAGVHFGVQTELVRQTLEEVYVTSHNPWQRLQACDICEALTGEDLSEIFAIREKINSDVMFVSGIADFCEASAQADVYVSDGLYEILCFVHPSDAVCVNQKVASVSALFCSDPIRDERGRFGRYFADELPKHDAFEVNAKVLSPEEGLVCVGDILIRLDSPVPKDAAPGEFVYFTAKRFEAVLR